jgi:hypothetical protein
MGLLIMYGIKNYVLEIKCAKVGDFLYNRHWFVKESIAEREVIQYDPKAIELALIPSVGEVNNFVANFIRSVKFNKKYCRYTILDTTAENLETKPLKLWIINQHNSFNVEPVGWFIFRLRPEERRKLEWNLNYINDEPVLYLSLSMNLLFGAAGETINKDCEK